MKCSLTKEVEWIEMKETNKMIELCFTSSLEFLLILRENGGRPVPISIIPTFDFPLRRCKNQD